MDREEHLVLVGWVSTTGSYNKLGLNSSRESIHGILVSTVYNTAQKYTLYGLTQWSCSENKRSSSLLILFGGLPPSLASQTVAN